MSLQDRKAKDRISQDPESRDVSKEVKGKRMTYKSPVPRRLNGSNRASTEPKIMLKKIRSIKLYKLYGLKRRGTSQLDWKSTDSSSNDFSDGKKYIEAKSGSEGESYSSSSGGSTASMTLSLHQKERKRESKSKKHACPSCFRPFDKDTKPILMDSSQQSLEEGSDALPDYATPNKGPKKQVQSPPSTSDSSFFSNESSEPSVTGSHFSQSKSAASSKKSLQTLTKSSSTRTGGNLRKKTSFKIKGSLVGKPPNIVQDLGLNRATCSSTLKDSKFPKQVELKPGQSESEIISAKKVCPYHHCSLHGHSHAPEPPQKRFLFRRRRTERTPKSIEPKGLSPDAVTSSGGKKKATQTGKTFSSTEPASAKSSHSTRSSHVKDHKTLDSSVTTITKPRIESYTGATLEKENATSDSCSVETKQHMSTSETEHTQLNGEEVHVSSAGIDIIAATMSGTTTDETSTLPQVLTSEDSAEATKDCMGVSSVSCCTSEELSASSEEKAGTSYRGAELITDSISPRDSKPSKENNFSPVIDEASNTQIKKNNHVSMWHMIHQQMVLGLAENQQVLPGLGEQQDNDDKTLPDTNNSQSRAEIFKSEMDAENQTQESKVLELRKIFAIKLVREAIEKILLPEVDDQTSDVMSITSEVVSDEEHPDKIHDGGEEQSISTPNEFTEHHLLENENKELGSNKSYDAKKSSLTEVTVSVSEDKTSKKSEKKALKGWSNLRKIVLLRRFVTELEKVKKFNPVQPRYLASEPASEAEKISLRRQMMGEKKNAEEWMLDYALRQVVSELAPTQKRKVALLVKAFETVVPPQEDQNIQVATPKQKIPTDLKDKEIKSNIYLNSDLQGGAPEFGAAELDIPRSVDGKTGSLVQSSATERNDELNQSDIVVPTLDTAHLKKLTADKEETIGQSRLEDIAPLDIPLHTDTSPASVANQEEKTQLYKQNVKMWHMIYRHVVSGIAEKIGTQLLDVDGEDGGEEIGEGNELLDGDSSSPMKTDQYDTKENHDTNHKNVEFSRSDALKLVQEAVDEILLPDIQDDSSDSKSIASDTLPDQELINKHQGDVDVPGIIKINETAEDSFIDGVRSSEESGVSLNQENEASPAGDINIQVDERAASFVKTNLLQQKSKNWSKLKKLILLKRSIKALENFRKLKPKPSQHMPLTSDPEEEKVNLKQQMTDERKKAEQWMLDYAVQHIVTKLTPARKRRVAMLVEAFEAVVPLPEV
ncbi:calmodulin binding protein PICBP [Daucus carota subsp. sativus]|uniref:calmodulin binding protein PICBP n=1 Tax=Daucus carota subsp. sativus TaxID=79200 RepID=UPI0030836AF5